MSSRVVDKMLRCLGVSALIWLAMPAIGAAQGCATCATPLVSFGNCCQSHHCPPAYKHCQEGPPRLHFHYGCPHPIAPPCTVPNWGYFETCWSPYPFQSDWSHCSTAPPAAFVTLNPMPQQYQNQGMPYRVAPSPLTPQQPIPQMLPPGGPGTPLPDTLPRPRPFDGNRPGL